MNCVNNKTKVFKKNNEYVFLLLEIAKSNDMGGEIREPWMVNEGFMEQVQLEAGKAGLWRKMAHSPAQT